MQLLNLTGLALLLTLVSSSQGQHWNITVPESINAMRGATVIILCNFTYPADHTPEQVYWKTNGKSECSKNDKDGLAFVSHPNASCVDPKYSQKTRLIGDIQKGNCSLQINNLQDNDLIYVRVVANKDKYSFKKNRVSIYLDGQTVKPDTFDIATLAPTQELQDNSHIYLTSITPLVLLLIVVGVVVGIVVYTKHRRTRSCTREASGYYVNFRRASSNQLKSEENFAKPCKTLDVKPPEEKVFDDPVYINVQAQANQTGHNVDQTDAIYANMDYSG